MHRFIDFKSFADAQLTLFRPLTLLIGKNGSGKSNAIEGVELLAELAHGRPLYEISDVGRGGAFEVRGGLAGCVREGKEIVSFEFSCSRLFAGVRQDCKYALSLRAKPEPRIAAESLLVGDRTLFATEDGSAELESGVLKVRYDNFARGGNKPKVTLAADRSVFSQYEAVRHERRKLDPGAHLRPGVALVLARLFRLRSEPQGHAPIRPHWQPRARAPRREHLARPVRAPHGQRSGQGCLGAHPGLDQAAPRGALRVVRLRDDRAR